MQSPGAEAGCASRLAAHVVDRVFIRRPKGHEMITTALRSCLPGAARLGLTVGRWASAQATIHFGASVRGRSFLVHYARCNRRRATEANVHVRFDRGSGCRTDFLRLWASGDDGAPGRGRPLPVRRRTRRRRPADSKSHIGPARGSRTRCRSPARRVAAPGRESARQAVRANAG
jgi:hypothetical protein